MDAGIIVLSFVFIVSIVSVIFFINKKLSNIQTRDSGKELLMLQQQIGQIIQTLDQRLAETKQELDRKLSESHKITRDQSSENIQVIQSITKNSRQQVDKINQQLRNVTEKLTKVDETQKQLADYSSQLKNLQDILKNPKQRGVLGEYYLEETLKNVLPPNNYEMQHGFKDGTIVDAVIFVKNRIIPVDSKFSLETYEQLLNCNDAVRRKQLEKQFKHDLKRRIDETSKYVKPNEDTVDFAFMFIPSESIYYDLLTNKIGTEKISSRDLIEYAFKEKHVIIVSPTSFLAYLQTVLQGLNMLKLEEYAQEIQKNVGKLDKHLQIYEAYHQKIGKSLDTTVNHYNRSNKEFKKIDKDIMKIVKRDESLPLSEGEIDRPNI
ncbi:MAG: DNA recombination protein RmuC [Patescibacteria group bacterium]|nr:DNA recombination protein RmuC [Patescibacteria group bacterium]